MSIEAIAWAMKHSQSRLGARLVMFVLAEYAHEDGTKAFPKVETVASKARLSRKGVQNALRQLEADGEIACTGQTKSGTNVYAILGMAGENLGEGGDEGAKSTTGRGEPPSPRGEKFTPDPFDDPVKDPGMVSVKDAWGKHSPPLQKHRDAYYEKPKVKTSIRRALGVYSADEIAKAIENYVAVVESADHYWSYRWTFQEFLDRGLDKFVDEASPLSNFRRSKDADAQGSKQRTPAEQLSAAEAWILNNAWRLPMEEWEIAEELGKRGVEGPDRARLVELWREKRGLLDDAA